MTESGPEFLCFAYGSNLGRRRLAAPSRAPSATRVAVGYVAGRRLAFDKYSSRDRSGKCDCEATGNPSDRVYGVIYRIAQSDRISLDAAEGLHHGYRDEIVTVVSGDAVYEALAYIATEKRTGLQVYDWYLNHVVIGAVENGLPADYIDKIRRMPTVPDNKGERASAEREIYQETSVR